MKDIVTLNGLMVFYLQQLRDTEKKWQSAIDMNYDKVKSKDLKDFLVRSDEASRNHLRKIDEVLNELGEEKSLVQSTVTKGILSEMEETFKITADPEVRDAAFLVFHQCMNHYKIAQYGSISSYAVLLGNTHVASIVHHLLEEEKMADEALTKLAESKINPQAQSPFLTP